MVLGTAVSSVRAGKGREECTPGDVMGSLKSGGLVHHTEKVGIHPLKVGGIRPQRDQVAQPSPGATTQLQNCLPSEGQQLVSCKQCPQVTVTLRRLEIGGSRPYVSGTIGVGSIGSPYPLSGVTGCKGSTAAESGWNAGGWTRGVFLR
jgi:hypothetical protein